MAHEQSIRQRFHVGNIQRLDARLRTGHKQQLHSRVGPQLHRWHAGQCGHLLRDPFVFLLHSNVVRLFVLWQPQPGHPERVDRHRYTGLRLTLRAAATLAAANQTGESCWACAGSGNAGAKLPWVAPPQAAIVLPQRSLAVTSHPSWDMAVALAALDALIHVHGAGTGEPGGLFISCEEEKSDDGL